MAQTNAVIDRVVYAPRHFTVLIIKKISSIT